MLARLSSSPPSARRSAGSAAGCPRAPGRPRRPRARARSPVRLDHRAASPRCARLRQPGRRGQPQRRPHGPPPRRPPRRGPRRHRQPPVRAPAWRRSSRPPSPLPATRASYIAGGVESMSRAPYSVPAAAQAFAGNLTAWDTSLGWRIPEPRDGALFTARPDGRDRRERRRAYGHRQPRRPGRCSRLASHQKAVAAWDAGFFAAEVVPVDIPQKGRRSWTADEGPRADSTLEPSSASRPPSSPAAASRPATARPSTTAPPRCSSPAWRRGASACAPWRASSRGAAWASIPGSWASAPCPPRAPPWRAGWSVPSIEHVGAQRGLRQRRPSPSSASSDLDEAGSTSARRRHRARPPARLLRRPHRHHAAPRPGPHARPPRPGEHVHRRRPGHLHRARAHINRRRKAPPASPPQAPQRLLWASMRKLVATPLISLLYLACGDNGDMQITLTMTMPETTGSADPSSNSNTASEPGTTTRTPAPRRRRPRPPTSRPPPRSPAAPPPPASRPAPPPIPAPPTTPAARAAAAATT
jgi:hypothetical protein